MSSNALEEGLLSNPSNPTHKDPARPAALLSAVVAVLSYFALRSVLPSTPVILLLLVSAAVFITLIVFFLIWLSHRAARKAAMRLAARRQQETQETQRNIAQMKREKNA